MIRATCPDCRQTDQMTYCPNASHTRWHLGCVRCQNAKSYPTFAAMWAAWCELATPQPEPPQPAPSEATP